MACPVGRRFDPDHPTCRSHLRQGSTCQQRARSKPKQHTGGPIVVAGRRGWMTTYDLQSANQHVNRPGAENYYRGIKRTWSRMLRNAALHFGVAKGRRRVEVVRYIPSQRWSMDEDNLWAACKPMIDCLVKQKVFVDDSRELLERVPPREESALSLRVEIFIDDL